MNQLITDPTDFRGSKVPQLGELDSLLRCHICKDFLKVPVLTPCSHTFCSICIREYINNQAKCPLCLSDLRESMLRSEFLVSELVQCYKSFREPLLNLAKDAISCDRSADSSIIELDANERVEKIHLPEETIPTVTTKEEDTDKEEDDIQILSTNDTRSNIRSKTDNPMAYGRVGKSSRRIQEMFQNSSHNSREKLAQCPICAEFFPLKTLERTHLDECLTIQSLGKTSCLKENEVRHSETPIAKNTKMTDSINSRATSASTRTRKNISRQDKVSHYHNYINSAMQKDNRQRLPKLDYASLSLAQLRQKLASLGISTAGSKTNMIARYNHYEMLWNSNFCDSMNPVEESELRRQLISWDSSHNITTTGSSTSNTIGKLIRRNREVEGSYQKLLLDFKTDKFEKKSWIQLFHKEFKMLIKEARRNMKNEEVSQKSKEN